uniref:Uncharacterized protein n=1 Tax=Rhizophora mucronata TaxID=61149 RepID=A0A2P2MUA4_RHIMU
MALPFQLTTPIGQLLIFPDHESFSDPHLYFCLISKRPTRKSILKPAKLPIANETINCTKEKKTISIASLPSGWGVEKINSLLFQR